MPTIVYESPDGSMHTVEARVGQSLMEAAVKHGVPGIVAECGGACSCATCHVYLDESYIELVGPAGEWESEMLEDTVAERTPLSRLSCQVRISEAGSDIRIRIAPEQ